jgi:hypothetical protein
MFLLVAILAGASMVSAQDTLTVRADHPAAWGRTTLTETALIGSLDGSPEHTFGLIGAVALGPDSTIYVADMLAPIIRRFTISGEYLGEVGGEGQGPGEYNQLLGMGMLPDGRLAAWDPRNLRLSLFQGSGEFDRSFNVQAGLFSADVFQIDHQGFIYIKKTVDVGGGPGDEWRFAWLKLAPSGEVVDTLSVPMANSTPSYSLATAEGYRRPFPIQTLSTISPAGYLVWGRTDGYAIYRPLSDGRVLRIERAFDPVPIEGPERRQWEAYSDRFERQSRAGGRSFDRPTIPDRKPPFRWLFGDEDGRIWVNVYAPAREAELTAEYIAEREADGRPLYRWRERPEWEVFHPSGRFLGRVTMPKDTYPFEVRGNLILATRRGEFDEGYVVVLRLETER